MPKRHTRPGRRRRNGTPRDRTHEPARIARRTGYRTDSARHQEARAKVQPARRREIAALGGQAHAAKPKPLHVRRPARGSRPIAD
jgi:hypothetical protein